MISHIKFRMCYCSPSFKVLDICICWLCTKKTKHRLRDLDEGENFNVPSVPFVRKLLAEKSLSCKFTLKMQFWGFNQCFYYWKQYKSQVFGCLVHWMYSSYKLNMVLKVAFSVHVFAGLSDWRYQLLILPEYQCYLWEFVLFTQKKKAAYFNRVYILTF